MKGFRLFMQIGSQTSTALTLLKSGTSTSAVFVQNKGLAGAAQKIEQSARDKLLANLSPEQREKLEKEHAAATQALNQVKSASSLSNENRKAAAKQKIEQIKAQLQMVRMMAMTNPKAAARMAAQLARELAAAVREYAAAGGTGGGGSASAGVASSSASTAAPASASASGSNSDAAGAEAAAVAPTSVPVAVTPTSASSGEEEGDAAQAVQSSDAGEDAAVTQTDADKKETERAAYRDQLNEKVSALNQKVAAIREDAEFKRMVREIVNALRSILEQAKQKAKDDKNENGLDHDIDSGLKALRDVEKHLTDMVAPSLADLSIDESVDTGAVGVSDAVGVSVNVVVDTGPVAVSVDVGAGVDVSA